MKKLYGLLIILITLTVGCAPTPPAPTVNTAAGQTTTTPEVTLSSEELAALEAKVPILIYHHIREFADTDSASDKTFIVSPQNLAEQFQYLTDNNFTTISFQNLIDYFKGKFELPAKPVIISFDDGVVTQYQNAFNLLNQHHLKATFFIFTNPIGRSQNYMTWEQLQELVTAGMEIGSHGHYHLYLTKITDPELDRELTDSKKIIENHLGISVNAIAHPFGIYNDHIIEAMKTAGYLAARDIVNGVSHKKEDLFKLKGYFITNDFNRFKSIINK